MQLSKLSKNSNTLAIKTRRLIGHCQKYATVYSAIHRRNPDVMINGACDWSTEWFYVDHAANVV